MATRGIGQALVEGARRPARRGRVALMTTGGLGALSLPALLVAVWMSTSAFTGSCFLPPCRRDVVLGAVAAAVALALLVTPVAVGVCLVRRRHPLRAGHELAAAGLLVVGVAVATTHVPWADLARALLPR